MPGHSLKYGLLSVGSHERIIEEFICFVARHRGEHVFSGKLYLPLSLCALLLSISNVATAEVYKCPGPSGSITISNIEKGPDCTKMVLPPPESKKSAAARAKSADAPKELKAAPEKPKTGYEAAASERKRVIQEEIDLERTRLNAVQARLKDLSAAPTKTPDQVKEMVGLQQKESMHASNIQLLQKELNR